MSFHQTVVLSPRFDYLRFYRDRRFVDCEIRVFETESTDDYQSIHAHRAILANACEFFYNMFTSGSQETVTGVVEVRGISYEPFCRVVEFLYSGNLLLVDDHVMIYMYLAKHFGIHLLQDLLETYSHSDQAADGDKIVRFIDQCFHYELKEELKYLEPVIAARYTLISIQNLSSTLDVCTFAHVLAKVDMSWSDRLVQMRYFMRNWECNPLEKGAIADLFAPADPQIRADLRKNYAQWLPEGWN
jgi:hypothetical protein